MVCRMRCVFIVCAGIMFVGKSDAAIANSLPNGTTIAPVTNELNCYTCYGVGNANHCLNYSNFEVAHTMWRQSVPNSDGPVKIETCKSPFNASCMILTYNNENGEVFHSRSCSDDVTFGLDPDKWARYLPITKHVQKDNETECAWDDTDMICVKLCMGDSGEPCNGPQLAGNFISASSLLYVVCACLQLLMHAFLQLSVY
ncbi:uncharacterized protein LOC127874216 [Dreissena polymorpha]|uniref:uncharacterized protein LOC127874216 n=1 Tax=Dreissena polymorpha TaxID=45954 RepID=UPI0022651FA8|nr:uncharacterized protein LOC127874216 [Dreissena polymorpha]